MPVNKSALLRYRIIDGCLTNPRSPYPSMKFLVQKIEEHLHTAISESLFNKDIQQLKEIYNAPIKFCRQRKGYYYEQPNFSIKEFPLTHEEIEALDFSTALLHQLKGTRMFQQFESAINKVIEGYRISKVIGKSEMQIIQVEEPATVGGGEWLEIILQAIVEKNVLNIKYQGYRRKEGTHEFSPYLLKEYRNRWYTVGFSNQKQMVIVLALDRIKQIVPIHSKFICDDDFNADKFFKYSFGITQVHNATPEKVKLAFSDMEALYIINQPLHHSQVVLSEAPELIIEMEIYITAELKMAILSYGKEVRVIEPALLHEEISECVREMHQMYLNKKSKNPENIFLL